MDLSLDELIQRNQSKKWTGYYGKNDLRGTTNKKIGGVFDAREKIIRNRRAKIKDARENIVEFRKRKEQQRRQATKKCSRVDVDLDDPANNTASFSFLKNSENNSNEEDPLNLYELPPCRVNCSNRYKYEKFPFNRCPNSFTKETSVPTFGAFNSHQHNSSAGATDSWFKNPHYKANFPLENLSQHKANAWYPNQLTKYKWLNQEVYPESSQGTVANYNNNIYAYQAMEEPASSDFDAMSDFTEMSILHSEYDHRA